VLARRVRRGWMNIWFRGRQGGWIYELFVTGLWLVVGEGLSW